MQNNYTVTLGDYKNLTMPKFEASVSETEVDLAINGEIARRQTMETVDAPAQNGDTVVIDYAGFLGEEQFEGGTSENYSLELGSHTFIPGFEEQLVGAVAGQDVDVNVTFPEAYHAPDLAGKAVVFKCKVHAVQQPRTPELNDEFAQKNFGVADVAALREAARQSILQQKQEQNMARAQDEVMAQVMERCRVTLGAEYLQKHTEAMMDYFTQNLAQQGLTLETYYKITGSNEEDLMMQVRPEAEKRAKTAAVLETIAQAEGIAVTEEDFETEIANLAKAYGTTADVLKQQIDETVKADIFTNMTIDRTMRMLMDNAN